MSIRALLVRGACLGLLLGVTACEKKPAARTVSGPAPTPGPATAPTPAEAAPAETAPVQTDAQPDTESWARINSNDGSYVVAYRTDPEEIPLNEPFSVRVAVFGAEDGALVGDDVTLDVDARMPAHKHGMVRAPTLVSNDDGTFTFSGMLFHMPGDWQLYFDVSRGGVIERAQTDIELE